MLFSVILSVLSVLSITTLPYTSSCDSKRSRDDEGAPCHPYLSRDLTRPNGNAPICPECFDLIDGDLLPDWVRSLRVNNEPFTDIYFTELSSDEGLESFMFTLEIGDHTFYLGDVYSGNAKLWTGSEYEDLDDLIGSETHLAEEIKEMILNGGFDDSDLDSSDYDLDDPDLPHNKHTAYSIIMGVVLALDTLEYTPGTDPHDDHDWKRTMSGGEYPDDDFYCGCDTYVLESPEDDEGEMERHNNEVLLAAMDSLGNSAQAASSS